MEAIHSQNALDVINALRPGSHSIKWHNNGDNRDVAVVDEKEVFRFPKSDDGIEAGRYEFAALNLVQGKLRVAVPKPIELAQDGSYNILEYLHGKVLAKHDVTALSYDHRRNMGIAIACVLNDLNTNITQQDILAIATNHPVIRNRDDYYAQVYETATLQNSGYATIYRKQYELLQLLRPNGSARNIIVFGDLSSPNLVLSDNYALIGLIDWTELGIGDIHNELRPVFSVIGERAFDETIKQLNPQIGPVNRELVKTLSIIHELSVLVNGKQRGTLTPARTQLAIASLMLWLDKDSLSVLGQSD